MQRLSNNIYVERYKLLRQLWQAEPRAFTLLYPRGQLELHAYYQPAKSLKRQELLSHRRALMQRDPSLANRAGKVYAQLRRALRGGKGAAGNSPVLDGVLMRAEPDYRKLARACVALARLPSDGFQ